MVSGACGGLEIIDEGTARIGPPGFRASWSTEPNPHWVLVSTTEAGAPAVAQVTT